MPEGTLSEEEPLWADLKRIGMSIPSRELFIPALKREVQKYTTDMILNHGKIGLMLGGDCTIDAKLDWERIRWVVEAARSI